MPLFERHGPQREPRRPGSAWSAASLMIPLSGEAPLACQGAVPERLRHPLLSASRRQNHTPLVRVQSLWSVRVLVSRLRPIPRPCPYVAPGRSFRCLGLESWTRTSGSPRSLAGPYGLTRERSREHSRAASTGRYSNSAGRSPTNAAGPVASARVRIQVLAGGWLIGRPRSPRPPDGTHVYRAEIAVQHPGAHVRGRGGSGSDGEGDGMDGGTGREAGAVVRGRS
jgi:hypothetical protein